MEFYLFGRMDKIVHFNDSVPADDFEVDYIKVWQNSNYESAIQPDDVFEGSVELD